MPLPVIPGVVRATVGGNVFHGGRWTNTMHYRRIDLADPTAGQIDALAEDVRIMYTTAVLSLCNPSTNLDYQAYTPLDGTSGAVNYGGNLPGTSSTPTSLPPECALVMTLRTAARGRRARGRIFLPAFSQFGSSEGVIDGSYLTSLLIAINNFRAAINSEGWEWGVASYGQSVKVNATTTPKTYVVTTWSPFFTPLTTVSANNQYDVIRSRKS